MTLTDPCLPGLAHLLKVLDSMRLRPLEAMEYQEWREGRSTLAGEVQRPLPIPDEPAVYYRGYLDALKACEQMFHAQAGPGEDVETLEEIREERDRYRERMLLLETRLEMIEAGLRYCHPMNYWKPAKEG